MLSYSHRYLPSSYSRKEQRTVGLVSGDSTLSHPSETPSSNGSGVVACLITSNNSVLPRGSLYPKFDGTSAGLAATPYIAPSQPGSGFDTLTAESSLFKPPNPLLQESLPSSVTGNPSSHPSHWASHHVQPGSTTPRMAGEAATMSCTAWPEQCIDSSDLSISVRRKLGCGSYGEVYEAQYKGRQVAAKVMTHNDKQCAFLSEACIHERLDPHTNIVGYVGFQPGAGHSCSSVLSHVLASMH
eukprot:gene25924-11601_t